MQRMDGAGPRYSQEEIRRILSRAVEIQARDGEPGAGVPALSLEDLPADRRGSRHRAAPRRRGGARGGGSADGSECLDLGSARTL